MPNDITINISLDPAAGTKAAGDAGSAPAPASISGPGTAGTAAVDAQDPGGVPAPLPLDQLSAGLSGAAEAPAPAPPGTFGPAADEAPRPLPLADVPPETGSRGRAKAK